MEMQHINLPVPRGSFSCEIVIVIPNCEKKTNYWYAVQIVEITRLFGKIQC